jgi:hypothetical protein
MVGRMKGGDVWGRKERLRLWNRRNYLRVSSRGTALPVKMLSEAFCVLDVVHEALEA